MSEALPPVVKRPSVPTYGIPDTLEGAMPWAWAEERLAAAETYWVAPTAGRTRCRCGPPGAPAASGSRAAG